MEYAIVSLAGKQYKMTPGQTISVERLEAPADSELTISDVLAYQKDQKTLVGAPFVKGVTVSTKVLGEEKAKKVRVLRFRAKSHYHKTTGHRHQYTKLLVNAITANA